MWPVHSSGDPIFCLVNGIQSRQSCPVPPLLVSCNYLTGIVNPPLTLKKTLNYIGKLAPQGCTMEQSMNGCCRAPRFRIVACLKKVRLLWCSPELAYERQPGHCRTGESRSNGWR